MDFVKRKHEFDVLANKIGQLQHELNTVADDALYYKDLLRKTRLQIIVIMNMVDAKTQVPNTETVDDAWERVTQAIITKLGSEDNDVKK